MSWLGGLGLALFFVVQLVALAIVPLGLPGTFVQVGAAAVLTLASDGAHLGWWWVGTFLVLALVGEVVEFLSGQWGARRFGGSSAAAWGALAGGLIGAIVGGIPVPVVGSVIASFIGTFVGAGGVRDYVIGRENRAATPEELRQMEHLVDQAMKEGALGLSTSLQYVPDRFASTEELIALVGEKEEP